MATWSLSLTLWRSAPGVHDNLALAIANDRVAPVKRKNFFGPGRHINQAVTLLTVDCIVIPLLSAVHDIRETRL
jgi:hypothetical protein